MLVMLLALFMLVMLLTLFVLVAVDVFAKFDRANALDCLMGGHTVVFSSLDYVEKALFECSAVANKNNCALHRCHLLS